MRRSRIRSAVLVIALVLWQWLPLAHSFEHRALAPDNACYLCVHAEGLSSGAVAASQLPELHFSSFAAFFAGPVTLTPRRPPAGYHPRGPPSILA